MVKQMVKQLMSPEKAAPSQGLMGVVAHLRKDNARLREALVEAQREAEHLASRGDAPGVDFGHLLELVRDFGDNLDCDGDTFGLPGDAGAEFFAIGSPRDDAEADTGGLATKEAEAGEAERRRLREALDASRREADALRAFLATRDQELAAARAALACTA